MLQTLYSLHYHHHQIHCCSCCHCVRLLICYIILVITVFFVVVISIIRRICHCQSCRPFCFTVSVPLFYLSLSKILIFSEVWPIYLYFQVKPYFLPIFSTSMLITLFPTSIKTQKQLIYYHILIKWDNGFSVMAWFTVIEEFRVSFMNFILLQDERESQLLKLINKLEYKLHYSWMTRNKITKHGRHMIQWKSSRRGFGFTWSSAITL